MVTSHGAHQGSKWSMAFVSHRSMDALDSKMDGAVKAAEQQRISGYKFLNALSYDCRARATHRFLSVLMPD
jgi:hypothetical protein